MRMLLTMVMILVLALPTVAVGEGSDLPVDAFIERTHIDADDPLRARIEAFLSERYISAQVLENIDDELLSAYARNLEQDLPISYEFLTDEPSHPLPEGAEIRQLAVLQPDGAAVESLVVDFERGVVYYDGTAQLVPDVCRARYAARLSDADRAAILKILNTITFEDRIGEIAGMEVGALRLCASWDGGVTRCAAMGMGVSEVFLGSVRALLDAGRAAAQGEHL